LPIEKRDKILKPPSQVKMETAIYSYGAPKFTWEM